MIPGGARGGQGLERGPVMRKERQQKRGYDCAEVHAFVLQGGQVVGERRRENMTVRRPVRPCETC